MSFETLGLPTSLVQALIKLGITKPTEVQSKAIPEVMKGGDLMVGAQTGTGKTAAFALPIIDNLLTQYQTTFFDNQADTIQHNDVNELPELEAKPQKKGAVIKALILTPTRELAQQVFDNINAYNEGNALRCVAIYGGTSIQAQTNKLKNGADIVVATPGRLLDHLFVGNLVLSQIQTLVLDEADRMLDMGFMPDLKRILRRTNPQRQTLLFSATFTQDIRKLAYTILRDPKEIQITPQNSTVESIEQILYPVDKNRKRELLSYLIGSKNWQQVLVFTKTRETSDVLAKELKLDGIKAASINGDKSQGARQKALDDFKSGKIRALIATDIAARGLDIHQLPYVINYDLPFKAEDYIHRIGRTGRAGQTGMAISFMSAQEEYLLTAIETLLDQRIPQEWLAGFEPSLNPIDPVKPMSRGAEKRKLKAKLKQASMRKRR